MTMKRRIFLSNTMMVLVSLLILFGIGGCSVLLFKEEFMNVIEQNAEVPDYIYEVQTLLLEQQQTPEDWTTLSQRLKEYDFDLYVSDTQEQEQFSNVRHSAMECIEELEEGEFTYDRVRLYSMEGITLARCLVQAEEQTYHVYAVYSPEETALWGIDRGIFEMFIIVFVMAGIVIIAALLLCSQLFTKMMIRKIMKPVDELNRAALRIKEGNLEEPIVYQEKDEFGEVCDTFNQMQRHLKEGIEKSQAYEKARTEMISGISHDLRTPLTSVKGFIKGMLDGIANTPEKQRQYLEISYRKACDMEGLLQKLFFLSKLETGNMPFFLQQVSMNNWLENYVREKQAEGIARIELETVGKTDSLLAAIDTEQMKRVLDNIIENSRKYAEVEDLHISIRLERKEQELLLTVADNGHGIAAEKLPHVFEQFYRGDESRNRHKDGSGLGLYVCQYIIEQQKGQIRAYQQDGFCVEITLPVSEEKDRA